MGARRGGAKAKGKFMARAVWRFVLLVSLVCAGGVAHAADTLRMTLKQNVSVAAAEVRFADVFAGAPAHLAEAVIAPAPEPGESVRYDAAFLIRAVRRHGVDWRPSSRFAETTVTRAAMRVTADEALSAVAAAVKQKARFAGELELKVESPIDDAFLPAGSAVRTDIVDVYYDPRSNRFRAGVELTAGGETKRFDVYGRAYEVLLVPTPARTLSRGDRIARADIEMTHVRADQLPPDAVLDVNAVLGMEVGTVLRAGRPLRQSDVMAATMIERGAIVAIVFQTAAMTLTSQGRALEDGATGATIRVANTQTNRVVHARVVAPNQVRVFNAAQLANR